MAYTPTFPISICLLAGLSLLCFCSSSHVVPVNPIRVDNGISRDTLASAATLIQLPTCLTAEPPNNSNLDSVAYGTYRDLRRDLDYASQMIGVAANYIDFYYNSMPHDTIDVSMDQRTRRRLWLDSTAVDHSRFKVWINSVPGMELSFSGENGRGRGHLTLAIGVLDPLMSPNLMMRIDFDAIATPKQMDLQITGASEAAQSGPGAPRNLIFHATEANGILSFWGGAYHQAANSLTHDPAWCSIFRGKADRAANTSSLGVALPSAAVTDSLLVFGQYGVDSVVPDWVDLQVRTFAGTDTVVAASVFACAKYNKALPAAGRILSRDSTADTSRYLCSEEVMPYVPLAKSMKDSLTSPIIHTFLHLNRNFAGWRELDDLLICAAQPAYINETDFLGCGPQAPTGVSAGLSDVAGLAPVRPSWLANLSITFETTAAPDF